MTRFALPSTPVITTRNSRALRALMSRIPHGKESASKRVQSSTEPQWILLSVSQNADLATPLIDNQQEVSRALFALSIATPVGRCAGCAAPVAVKAERQAARRSAGIIGRTSQPGYAGRQRKLYPVLSFWNLHCIQYIPSPKYSLIARVLPSKAAASGSHNIIVRSPLSTTSKSVGAGTASIPDAWNSARALGICK